MAKKCVKKYKNLIVEGGRDDYLFWTNAQNQFFFNLEVTPAYQVIKRLKINHLWV